MTITLLINDSTYIYDTEEDFISEVGAEAWEQGLCIDAEDFIEALQFAEEVLDWTVIKHE